MAFSFSSSAGGGGAFGGSSSAAAQNAQLGPELQEIQTQEVGFQSIAGDAKIRLLPSPWPQDALPPPTASLLSVASSKGLLVAAGPEGLVIASTDSVRKAYSAEASGESEIRPFQPQLQIPLPQKASHVAFSADENVLVVAAADGSGLIAYDVAGLLQGNTQPALTLGMNGASLRALVPNPTIAELFAAVTTNGELLMANLKSNQLVQGPSGPVLKTGVSCVSWSTKGKQLVAGLADGSASQMTPEGEQKAQIPKPADLEDNQHVSAISWLENNLFFMVYTPNSAPPDEKPPSSYYILTRQPPNNYAFQKLPEVCAPFGMDRCPATQFIGRLRNFEPNLKDVLIVASTPSSDIGLFTRSSKALSTEVDAASITDVFTATSMSEDSRRAAVPMTEDFADTSPIGLAIDLSSKDVVASPLPGEDIKDSVTPLPGILVLNNDGVLSSWWFVYSESIRQQKPYHELMAVKGSQPSQPQQPSTPAPALTPQTPKTGFGQPSFGQPAFGKPSTPSFGTPAALGAGRQPAFGAPSPLGGTKPTWATSGFGTPSQPSAAATTGPAFGSTTPIGGTPAGPAFGAPSAIGQRTPAFGQASSLGTPSAPAFGQPSGIGSFGTPAAKPASGLPSAFGAGSGGGFSSFASSGGFASAAAAQPSGESPFAKAAASDNPFAKSGQTLFGATPTTTSTTTPSGFGLPSSGFALGSSFKAEETTTMDEDKPEREKPSTFSMGSAFGNILNLDQEKEQKPPEPKSISQPPSLFSPPPEPESKPLPPKPETSPLSFPPQTSLFGALPRQAREPEHVPMINGAPISPPESKEPAAPPALPSERSLSESTVKVEPPSPPESAPVPRIAEPPLPPEPTSRATYGPGDTSASSSSISKGSYEEAPLPPDFIPVKKPEPAEEAVIALPEPSDEEDEGADFEDSGEEVSEGEASPVDEEPTVHRVQSLKTSPESSFDEAGADRSPESDVFTKVSLPAQQDQAPRQLFGEITTAQPVFPPPRLQQGGRSRLIPRSPSPIRTALGKLRGDGMRSASAPGAPGRALAQRKVTLESSMLTNQIKPPPEELKDAEQEEKAKLQAQRLALEAQQLDEDVEDEQLRADLARPLSPAPTLDPFLPHQDYTGESLKPGIPGQIEKLYRDINYMIDTLGINSRSLSSYLLFQETAKEPDFGKWLSMLQSEYPSDILDERLLLSEVDKLKAGVEVLDKALLQGKVESLDEKLEKCQQLFSKDLVTLRGQCASIRRTIDVHTDSVAIASAPLSAEQAALQQDLRKASTAVQSKMADLEKDISILRAKIADSSRPDSDVNGSSVSRRGRRPMTRPTVEAVTSTISTMTNMAEKKSGDIDVLEAQLRKLGIDVSGASVAQSPSTRSREASPFLSTPPPKRHSRLPMTPGSRGSVDRSAYHTPESTGAVRFRSSLLSSAGKGGGGNLVVGGGGGEWKAKALRRREMVGHVRNALASRKVHVRGMDEL
ncbi:hypothetical protein AJ80_08479 [Polytolypa hystricis UAMH7299]|uniref:Nucleoporin Nup159/Nup146 N-terminal domain-containing protein n=1 Tax=Polytolypa hystricis (strain UAMH7299) TaxID=1447883 RepID=A0A2B7X6Q7_POLH7|nr:hypothetical protein AJ80_08479 [Polytolypa hystricis UAMH7299]